jgi:hypothetical protein
MLLGSLLGRRILLLRLDARFPLTFGPRRPFRPLRLGRAFGLRRTFGLGRAIIAALRTVFALAAMRLVIGRVIVRSVFGAVFAVIAVAIRLAAFLPTLLAAIALLFLTDALVGEHAEIVIGELEVIFLLHAVAIEVRVVRQLAVLLEQLRRIPTRPAVDPVDVLAALLTIVVVTPAAPAVIPTIIVQG